MHQRASGCISWPTAHYHAAQQDCQLIRGDTAATMAGPAVSLASKACCVGSFHGSLEITPRPLPAYCGFDYLACGYTTSGMTVGLARAPGEYQWSSLLRRYDFCRERSDTDCVCFIFMPESCNHSTTRCRPFERSCRNGFHFTRPPFQRLAGNLALYR